METWFNCSLNGNIAAINNIIAGKQYKFAGMNGVTVVRSGNVCYLTCVAGNYTNSAEWGVLTVAQGSTSAQLVLPVGFRPIVTCELRDNIAGKRITADRASGEIVCVEHVTSAVLRFSGAWITEETMPT